MRIESPPGKAGIPLQVALSADGPVLALARKAFPHLLSLYAFGSRIHGASRDDSDLDLAVLVAGYAPVLKLWDTASELSELLGIPVDLIDLRAASTVMQHQVLTTGRSLWARQPEASLFECFALSEKNHLDEARQALLNDVSTRGQVYGR